MYRCLVTHIWRDISTKLYVKVECSNGLMFGITD